MPKFLINATVALVLVGLTSQTGWADQTPQGKHQHLQGGVVEKAGALAMKVPNGTTYQLNENRALRGTK